MRALLPILFVLPAFLFDARAADGAEPATGERPVVLRVSESVAPGGVVSLYGEFLQEVRRVRFLGRDGSEVARVRPIQIDPDGQFCRIVFPDIAPGAYAVVAESGSGSASRPVFVNRPEPRWLSQARAYPGMRLKLLGRNLDAGAYGGTSATRVRLVSAGRGNTASCTARVEGASPYCVRFSVPADAVPGSYYVEVKTGSAEYGGQWLRLKNASECPDSVSSTVLRIESAPADSTARALGVAWANDFRWHKVYDVKGDFGAAGNGMVDDTAAIQRAIDEAGAAGGGVVFVPRGRYRIGGLKLRRGVVLKGEDPAESVLAFRIDNPRRDGAEYAILETVGTASTDGLVGVANLLITIDEAVDPSVTVRVLRWGHTAWPIDLARLTATRFFLFRNRIRIPLKSTKWTGMLIHAAGPVLIAENQWVGNEPAWSHGIKRGLICRDNTFEYANGQVSLSSDRMVFENNTLEGRRIPGVTTNLHGLFTESWFGYNVWHKYIANNRVRKMDYVPGNDGEAFCLDSPGFLLFGDVVSAGPNSVAIRADSVATTGSIGWHLEWQALVIRGRGLGQLRRLAGHRTGANGSKVHHLRVQPAWTVPPDSTSKIAIVRMQVDTVFENNLAVDCCGPATMFYYSCYDCVAYRTRGVNTQGVINYGGYFQNPHAPAKDRIAMMSFFATVRDCSVSGASPRFRTTWIGNRGEDGLSASPCFATAIYGAEYRGNTVDRAACRQRHDYDGKNPAGFCVAIQNPETTGRSILATLFDGNAVRHSKYGWAINSPGCSDTLIHRVRGTDIGTPLILDQGTRTRVTGVLRGR